MNGARGFVIMKTTMYKSEDINQKLLEITSGEIGSEVIKQNVEEETNKVYIILQYFGDQR